MKKCKKCGLPLVETHPLDTSTWKSDYSTIYYVHNYGKNQKARDENYLIAEKAGCVQLHPAAKRKILRRIERREKVKTRSG